MSRTAQALMKPATLPSPAMGHMLQRKCDCGAHTPGGGTCERCAGEQASLQRKLAIGAANDPLEHEADRVADQVLSGPTPAGVARTPFAIRRFARDEADTAREVPPSVHRTLGTPGSGLDRATRQDMEQRFGHDFSQVRVHRDCLAAQSARDFNAHAYTVGRHIIFGAGQFAPHSSSGRRLLAHELTHVVQQSGTANRVQRQGANELDDRAKAIISAAKDASTPINVRAINAVKAIVSTYYDSSMVAEVVYDEADPGLTTSPVGEGKAIKGKITVGKYFVDNIDKFARRVIQVGHELQHVQQQRQGMGGPQNRNEREFLAHSWASKQDEKPGTGRMAHANRVAMIDEALKNYFCMSAEKQTQYKGDKDALLTLRATEEAASGKQHTNPPTACANAPLPAKNEPADKKVTTHPEPQKVTLDASAVGEIETKKEGSKRETEGAGKFAFELVIPITGRLKLGPLSFLKETGLELNLGAKSGPAFALGAEATLKMISLDFEKIKTPLGLVDLGISGSALAGADYQTRDPSAAYKFGVSGEAEAKLTPVENKPFFIKVKGGAEKTYGKESGAEWRWGPVTWTTSLSVGFNLR